VFSALSVPRLYKASRLAAERQTDRPVLSSERASHIKNPQWSDSNKNLVISPRLGLDTKTDWPTDRRSSYNSDSVSAERVLVEFHNSGVIEQEMARRLHSDLKC
jgi:hypothetical protein